MTAIDSNAWDADLASRSGHFLQSSYWINFQKSLGQEIIFERNDDFMWAGYIVVGRGGLRYLYVPYGPTLSTVSNDNFSLALSSMRSAAQHHKCIFVRFDQITAFDMCEMQQQGCVYFGYVQPDTTHVLNLEDELSDTKSRMSKTDRNLINRSEKNGTEYAQHHNLKYLTVFLDLMLGTANYKAYRAKSRSYLESQIARLVEQKVATIYTAQHEGEIVAGAIGIDWAGVRYYLHAGGDQAVIRKLPIARGLVWYMIKDAKDKSIKYFDFYGVSPDKNMRDHALASVSSFKRSFVGSDKHYGGTWDLPVQKSKYRLYRYLRSLR